MEHNIYVLKANNWIKDGKQIFKIGSTKNIKARLQNLKTGNPYPIILLCLYKILNYNCYKLDNIIKTQLKHHNINSNGGIEFYEEFDLQELEKLFLNLDINFEKSEPNIINYEPLSTNEIFEEVNERLKMEKYEHIFSETDDTNGAFKSTLIRDRLPKTKYNGKEIMIIFDENMSQWFSASQIAKLLCYSKPELAIRENVVKGCKEKIEDICKNYKKFYKNCQPNTIFINRNGLYSLIINSHKDVYDTKIWLSKELLHIDI
ncbi:MAG: superfamily II DNA or RNA helicase [Hyperionvirus sp.]|uniref:Superfamily II DNA or RNA helicase n=1 Tax=Hyperionvirus sp. TaxID=2487770 RepID=A0A3G5A7F0_9VIRU|nr:MAG: superfamily II DNA or RNA helicase [Hyperionvirus sp.]